ncbi:MAG: ABC transporter substrate-binding protein [Clostridia bacterium]|nr:ABC transporter substrate-binding protein [Clostridia bacterium]
MKKLFTLVLAMLLITSCIAGASAEKVLHLYMGSDTETLNGQNSVETNVNTPATYCQSTLYRAVPDEDGLGYHYIGEIAADLPQQIDDYTWRIPLRPEACWANGEPINADTMIYSYKMGLNPVLSNSMANFIADQNITIKNATAYNLQTSDAPVAWEDVGIKKIDDYTLEIVTEGVATQATVCSHFTTRAVVPVYEPLYEAGMAEDRTSTTYGSTEKEWMASGPYKIESWVFGSVQTYVRNENYWLPELFHYDRIEIRIIPEMNSRVELWEKGELDYLGLDSDYTSVYIDDPRTLEAPSLTVYHIDLNCKNPNNPLSGNANFRKAMYHAMNREVIAEDLFEYQTPSGVYVNTVAGSLSDSGLTYRNSEPGKAVAEMVESWGPAGYSPELAREYLAKAYEECGLSEDTVITLIFAYDQSETHWNKTAQYLQAEFPTIFEGKIQLDFDYHTDSATSYKQTHDTWDFSPNDWTRGASRTYPHTCFYYYLSTYSSHPNNFFDEEFEAQYAVCESEEVKTNYDRLLEETKKLEEIYLEKVIHIPVVQETLYEMYSDRLVLPVEDYTSVIGWGIAFADIVE